MVLIKERNTEMNFPSATTLRERTITKTTDLNHEFLDKNILRNELPRFSWSRMFGISLTKYVARLRAEGLDASQTFRIIIYENPNLTTEEKRRLKIGVSARFGEMKSAEKEKERMEEKNE